MIDEVVDQRRQRRREEVLPRVEDAGDHARDAEEDRRDQHQPREPHRERLQLGLAAGVGAEAGREQRHDPRRERVREHGHDHGGDADEVEDIGREAPRGLLALAHAHAAERGDERGRQRRAGEHLEHEVGEAEGDPVRAQLGVGAEGVGYGDGAQQPQQAGGGEPEARRVRRRRPRSARPCRAAGNGRDRRGAVLASWRHHHGATEGGQRRPRGGLTVSSANVRREDQGVRCCWRR